MSAAPAAPRRRTTIHLEDAAVVSACIASSFALVWLVYTQLTPLSGKGGFAVFWLAGFVAIYWLVVKEMQDSLAAIDRLVALVLSVAAVALLGTLVLVAGFVVVRGIKALTPAFFTETLQFVGPLDPATEGGALHAIVGTLEQIGIAAALSVPLGFMTAVFLSEVGGRLRRPIRIFVDAMSGVPSIVAGLFIYSVWIVQFGNRFSGFAAGMALAVLMLPIVTRTAEEVLRLVPGGLREASLALGAPEWKTTLKVLPTAKTGLITASILGVARSVGETAPLIMTSFGNSVLNANPFEAPQDSLPLFAFRLLGNPQQVQINRAWTGALVLICIVLALFIITRVLGSGVPGRMRRRRAGASA